MREALFRGKRVDNGEWVEGGITFAMDGTPYICPARFSDYNEEIEVLPETVGQWIGVTDVDGKKIFEGDILQEEYYADGDEIGVVVHDDRKCWYLVHSEKYGWWKTLDGTISGWKVIGNIHDNAKLLEDA